MTLVAFIIEFDNEFERQMPHWTTNHGGSRKTPWLGSMELWWSCMRFVGEEGVRVRDLAKLARTGTNLNGMERWRYVEVRPDASDKRPKPPRSDWVIRATPGGLKAREVWRRLFGPMELRWRERFGADKIERLREALRAVISQFQVDLPDCLPILGYGMFSRVVEYPLSNGTAAELEGLPLPALLSKVLLAFAIAFERKCTVSLAISANIMRVLGDAEKGGVRVRDLPPLSGIAKESIAVALGYLQKRELVDVGTDTAGSRTKIARLTAEGKEAYQKHRRVIEAIEERWAERFGREQVSALRDALQVLVGDGTAEGSPLFRGLEPYPDGWRMQVPRPKTLPHYPMVTHRGGYPDGS